MINIRPNDHIRKIASALRINNMLQCFTKMHKSIIVLALAIILTTIGSAFYIFNYASAPASALSVEKIILHSESEINHHQLCIDNFRNIKNNGTPTIAYPCNANDPAQQWTLYSDNSIRITSTECLDIKSPYNTSGARVIIYHCNNSKTQKWNIQNPFNTVGNYAVITSYDNPKLCLSVPRLYNLDKQLTVSTCTGASSQKWTIQPYRHVTAIKPAIAALQSLYNNQAGSPSRGLFCSGNTSSSCWWESANELDNIINYTEQTGNYQYANDIAITFNYSKREFRNSIGPFLDRYNDDDAWWGLTWLNAYSLTGNTSYLKTAENIFSYIQKNGWTSQCNGGVYQFNGGLGANGLPATKDDIANSLYITLASRLYQATRNNAYLQGSSGAIAAANWFLNSGMIVRSGPMTGLVNDNLINPNTKNGPCGVADTNKSTYNQGQIIDALANLYSITHNKTYLSTAQEIASAVINDISNSNPPLIDKNGVLTETCVGAPYNCSLSKEPPFLQWKGNVMRGMSCLNAISPNNSYAAFFVKNTNFLYKTYPSGMAPNPLTGKKARSLEYFGFYWDKYDTLSLGSATQGSALDALESSLGGSQAMCNG